MGFRPVDNEPAQEALFNIEGPDEDGCVWICSAEGRHVWCENLGPVAKVAEVLSQWLGSIDYDQQDELTPEAIEAGKRQAKIDRKAARPEDNREEGGQG